MSAWIITYTYKGKRKAFGKVFNSKEAANRQLVRFWQMPEIKYPRMKQVVK